MTTEANDSAEGGGEDDALTFRAARSCACAMGELFDLYPETMFAPTRGSALESYARHLLVTVLCVELEMPQAAVARVLKREPKAVRHALQVIEDARGEDRDMDESIEWLGVRVRANIERGEAIRLALEAGRPERKNQRRDDRSI